MGKEMRELHKVHKLAIELIRSGRISWNDAIEKAKEKLLSDRVGAHKSDNNLSKQFNDSITEN